MRPRKSKLDDAQQQWVRDWWRALQPRSEGEEKKLPGQLNALRRGERAQLRRCVDVSDLLAHRATLLLADRLIALAGAKGSLPDRAISYERVAVIAGVLAVVKVDLHDGKTLAWHLGHGAGNEEAKMSDRRFKVLQRSATVDELLRHVRRAMKLAGAEVDVVCLADDLLSWQIEMGHSAASASQGVKFHWAYDYYLSAQQRKAASEPEFIKEISE